jgi:prepilin-type N-terminal cleavage/methylation domain-containing protein/prepilin-type processing-associated H-X9-DG protein
LIFWRAKNFACVAGLRYNANVKPDGQNQSAGFSLIELLITVALLAVLSAMMYGFASGKHQRDQKLLCADNLQKIYLALQIYANDIHGTLPAITNAQTSEDALTLLTPKYSSDTSIFICPGGRDAAIPAGEALTKNKISYAYYMGQRLATSPDAAQIVLMSDRQIDTDPKRAGEFVFSPDGKSPGNNHHKFGGNFLFADGSVQASKSQLTFSLPVPANVRLLNPKP